MKIEKKNKIYIWSNDFHTGIMLLNNSKLLNLFSDNKTLTKYKYTDFGWGEFDFYTSANHNILSYLRAAVIPTKSTLRVKAHDDFKIKITSKKGWMVMVPLDQKSCNRLIEFIKSSMVRKNSKNELALKENSRTFFYNSPSKYHIFNTCNTWVARALKNSGLKIGSFGIITSRGLYRALKNSDSGVVVLHH